MLPTIWGKYVSWIYTGWSKATVTNVFSLANLKTQKSGVTQSFLESWFAAVLVFWCLSMVRWKKLCLLGRCQNGVLAPYCIDWEPRYPPNTPKRLRFPWIRLRHRQTPFRHSTDIPHASPEKTTCRKTATDANWHHQTYSSSTCQCLAVSVGVCWHVVFTGDVLGVSLGCLGGV